MADTKASARQFLVVDENGEGHLKVRQTPDGPFNHGLMGAAHAALMSPAGFRGNRYEGPNKEEAIRRLRRLYEEEGMPWPEERACEYGITITLDRLPAPFTAEGRELYHLPVMPAGEWQRFKVMPQQLEEMARNFAARENAMIPVDYDHAMELLGEHPDLARGGPVPAAGWVHSVRVEHLASAAPLFKDVLVGAFEFTPRALAMIRSGEYRFLSPAWVFQSRDRVTGAERGAQLLSVGLTNKPFFTELPAIKCSAIALEAAPAAPPQSRRSETAPGGTNVEQLTARKAADGKFEIVRGTEILGAVDIPGSAEPTAAQVATVIERLGAKGQTEEELKTALRKGRDEGGRAVAQKLLASECVKDGKLDRGRMKVLARESKVGMEDFLAFEDAFTAVEEAVRAGKILPRQREYFLGHALGDVAAFKAFAKDALKVIATETVGIAGSRTPTTAAAEMPAKVSAGKQVVHAERVARIRGLQRDSAKQGKELNYQQARTIVLAEEKAAGVEGDGQGE